jgi:hypothetical protein
MAMRRTEISFFAAGAVLVAMFALACSDDESGDGGGNESGGGTGASANGGSSGASSGGTTGQGGRGGAGVTGGSSNGGATSGGTATGGGAGSSSGGSTSGSGGSGGDTSDAGWLYTEGNKIHVSDGKGGGSVWVGRGVNVDDIFMCGYNYTLWMESPEDAVTTMLTGLMRDWKPTFLRVSLAMASFGTTVSWLEDPATYRQPMTEAINAMLAYPNTYVLVTLRSDGSMILHDEEHGNPEATGLPSDSTNTPNAAEFPDGTDAVYRALVQTFGASKNVLFGITNEPGGNLQSDERIRSAMVHAVDTIRAEEDRLGMRHHVIAVQGQGWTGDISYYATRPLTQDNIVYEVHGYPPPPSAYTYSNLPVILGEYGSIEDMAPAFYADIESKQISSLAWDFSPFSNCAPDLVEVTQDPTELVPTAWGEIVQDYLLEHAP